MTDIEVDLYADIISLHKFDKTTHKCLWEIEINGVPLGGGRSHHNVLQQNDELILLFEQTEEEVQRVVGRSKEDGSEVWPTEIGGDDRKDGTRQQ